MQRTILVSILFTLLSSVTVFAQSPDTFDIATFQPPKGWSKQAGNDAVQFSISDKDDYCLVTLFRSMPSLGGTQENFKAAWETLVKETVTVKAEPEMLPADTKDEWIVAGGFAPFEKNGSTGVAVLYTATGYDHMVNALVLTNTRAYEPQVTAFLSSISFKKLAVTPPPKTTAANEGAAILGQWGISLSPQDNTSVNNGIIGYTTRQYTFHPDGTYEFLIKLFAYTSPQILFTRETGTYRLSGSELTLTPLKGSIQAWTKATVRGGDGKPAETDKWGKLVSTQSWPLEKATYQIAKEYMNGPDKWQLRMVTANPTKRDGPFTGSSAWPNTYFYETMRFPIEPPR